MKKKWFIKKVPTWGPTGGPQVIQQTCIVCLLCASCQATALVMVFSLHVLKRNHKTQVRKRALYREPRKGMSWTDRSYSRNAGLEGSSTQLSTSQFETLQPNPKSSCNIVRTVSMFKALNCNFLFNNWKQRIFLRRSSPWDGRMRSYPGYEAPGKSPRPSQSKKGPALFQVLTWPCFVFEELKSKKQVVA